MATEATVSHEGAVGVRRGRGAAADTDQRYSVTFSWYGGPNRNPSRERLTVRRPGKETPCSSIYSQGADSSNEEPSADTSDQPATTLETYEQQVHEASELLSNGRSVERSDAGTPDATHRTPDGRSPDHTAGGASSKGGDSPSSFYTSLDDSVQTTFDHTDLLPIEGFDDSKTLTSSLAGIEEYPGETGPNPEGWSPAVRKLITETDLAFDGISTSPDNHGDGPNSLNLDPVADEFRRSNPELASALAPSPLLVAKTQRVTFEGDKDGRAPSHDPRRSSRLSNDSIRTSRRRRSISVPSPAPGRRAPSPPRWTDQTNTYMAPRTPPVPMTKRAAVIPVAVPIAAETTSSNRKARPLNASGLINKVQKHASTHLRRPSRASWWGISGNVSGIFTSSVFRRDDVDELLTADQLEKLKLKREMETARRKESIQEGVCAGPMPGRMGLAAEGLATASQTSLDMRQRSESDQSLSSPRSSSQSQKNDEEHALRNDPNLPLTPPRKSKHRSLSTGQRYELVGCHGMPGIPAQPLPCPEDPHKPPLPPKNPRRYKTRPRGIPLVTKKRPERKPVSKLLGTEENDEYLYLKSTPYSLATSQFRHGPIRIPKSELGKGAVAMDETLDWTAFQMAILGANDMGSYDGGDDGDYGLVEEMAEWFDEFGLETHGELIPEPADRAAPHTPSPSSSSSRSSVSSTDLPIQSPGKDGKAGKTPLATPLGRWPLQDGRMVDKRMPEHRGADEVQPLVVDDGEHDVSVVHRGTASVGSNLHGDLGEFLRWESQFSMGRD